MVDREIGNRSPALRACWHPVMLSGELGTGPSAVRLLGQNWVLARLDGEVVALRDRCPHRGAPLSAGCVVDATLRCPYHGWRYRSDGRCVDIPALGPDASIPGRARVDAAHVCEHEGIVWLAPDDPLTPLPAVPASADPDLHHVGRSTSDWRAGAAQMLDNFLDLGHFPFSHGGSFGVAEDLEVEPFSVRRDGWEMEVVHRHRARLVDSEAWRAGRATPRWRTQRYRYTAPFTLSLELGYDDEPDRVALLFAVQPVDDERSRLFSAVYRNDAALARCTPEEAGAAGALIIEEDRSVLEQIAGDALPLDLRAELHTRADRMTVELRRILAELVERCAAPPVGRGGGPSPMTADTHE